jgi:hypothetical protein
VLFLQFAVGLSSKHVNKQIIIIIIIIRDMAWEICARKTVGYGQGDRG